MPRLRSLASGALLLLVAPVAARAQSDSRLWPPALVADSFFRATRDARWLDAARLMDLDAISAMRDRSVRLARRQPPRKPVTAEDILKHAPKMPRAVAEYQAEQSNIGIADFDPLAHEYANVPSVDSLARLSPADVAARWLEARDVRWSFRRSLLEYQKRGCIPADSVEVMVRAMRPGAARIIGTVIDDSLAYVLHERALFDEADRPAAERARARPRRTPSSVVMPPSVASLRRVGSEWRIIPSYDPGAAVGMVSATECSAPGPSR